MIWAILANGVNIEPKGMIMSTQSIVIGIVVVVAYIAIAVVVANLTPSRAKLRARSEAIKWLTAILIGDLLATFVTLIAASQGIFTVLPDIVNVAIPGMAVALVIIALWVLCLVYGFRFTDSAVMKSSDIVKAESAKVKSPVAAKPTKTVKAPKAKDSDIVSVAPEDFLGTRTDTPKAPASSEPNPPSYQPYHTAK